MRFQFFTRLPTALISLGVRCRTVFKRHSGQILILVFSKDRPLQLDLLFRTMATHVNPLPVVHVLYRASTEDYRSAYHNVFRENSGIEIVAHSESSFKADLLEICRASFCDSVMFLVDDIAFLRPFNLSDISRMAGERKILSIRLGLNITRSQTGGGMLKAIPPLKPLVGFSYPLYVWKWSRAEPGHWSLPTSLDGNILPLQELIPILEATNYKAPNSLEAALGKYRFLFKYSLGVCYELPRIVNFPLNSVKTEDFDFPHLGLSVDDMLKMYMEGGRLDISDFPHMEHDSCHMAWTPKLLVNNVPASLS